MRSAILVAALLVGRNQDRFTDREATFVLACLVVALLMDIAELLK